MSRTKEQKKEITEKLNGIVKDAISLVFVNIHGLKVADATVMRRKLKSERTNCFFQQSYQTHNSPCCADTHQLKFWGIFQRT